MDNRTLLLLMIFARMLLPLEEAWSAGLRIEQSRFQPWAVTWYCVLREGKTRHLTFTMPLSIQAYKYTPGNLMLG